MAKKKFASRAKRKKSNIVISRDLTNQTKIDDQIVTIFAL